MESQKSGAVLVFATAAEADRRVAGAATAARLVRGLAQDGIGRVTIALPDGSTLAPATRRDLDRIAAAVAVDCRAYSAIASLRPGNGTTAIVEAPRLEARTILAATAKASDGLVSRWLNRPVSQLISAALLTLPWIRPVHATIGTAAIAGAMFLCLLLGGPAGALAGGLLFHAASVFDGVDGEIARATYRASPAGARLDTAVDVATNLLFVLGLTLNLSDRFSAALPVGLWGLLLFAAGLALLGAQAARMPGDFSLDLLKHGPTGASGRVPGALTAFLTAVTGRDFFALLFAVLLLAGQPMAVLWIFALAATVWLPAVAMGVVRLRRAAPLRRSA